MKLVQLLAKELKEWPDDCDEIWQSAMDREIYFEGGDHGYFELSNAASDRSYEGAHVTREQWQAEREKMNKPKWIRHRGGINPINDDVFVEVKLRSGDIQSAYSSDFIWRHVCCDYSANIMQYRIMQETENQEIEEVKDTNLGTLTYKLEIDATEATQRIDSLVAKWGQIVSPLKWRDAIIHCQAIIEDCEREIERNINLLDAEGLMMQKYSKKAMQHYAPDVDMSDWRNWKRGDIISISNDPDIKDGEYKVTSIEEYDYDGDLPVQVTDGWADFSEATVKFVRRP